MCDVTQNKVTSVKFVPSTRSNANGNIEVVATFEDKSTGRLFDFYDDEIRFTSGELIGKTKEEANRLFFDKDQAYLNTP
jgi:hypothetical protein